MATDWQKVRLARDVIRHGTVIERWKGLTREKADARAEELRLDHPDKHIEWVNVVTGSVAFFALPKDAKIGSLVQSEVATVGQLLEALNPFDPEARLAKSVTISYHLDLVNGSTIRIRED
jgi:hypothetical protein